LVDFNDETKTITREMVFATVFVDDRMVQLEMVKAGFAKANEVRGDLS
jgi:endonuclease YncB( thermonuclease family)